jgi:hypothetical protein
MVFRQNVLRKSFGLVEPHAAEGVLSLPADAMRPSELYGGAFRSLLGHALGVAVNTLDGMNVVRALG